MWLYIPVCIRVSNSDRLSGIHVVNIENSSVCNSFCLTVCHLPLPLALIHVAAPQLSNDILWHNAIVSGAAPIALKSDILYLYLREALSNGFNLFPLDSVPNATLNQLQVMKLQCDGIYTPETARAFSPLELGSVPVPSPITVRSTPFSFTAPVAFADFLSSGYINCVLRNSSVCGYLSDVKYLDNMVGGISNSGGRSIGLVVGTLRKENGDGELVVVCLWHQLWRQLRSYDEEIILPPLDSAILSIEPFSTGSLYTGPTLSSALSGPVLPLMVDLKDGASWGSCVLLDGYILVTNNHVIQPWSSSKDGQCSILLPDRKISLGPDDEVVVPYNNLDLVFVKISPQNQLHFSQVKTARTSETRVSKGDVVRAAGYGLFVNKGQLEPLISEGRISGIVSTCPFPNSKKMPCMLIASSSCWNGSSGGGLFDSHGNLVGILCSNAQVFVPSVGDEQQTEKVPLFALCIPIELVMACYERRFGNEMSQNESNVLLREVEHVWQLKSTHRDMYQRNVKL